MLLLPVMHPIFHSFKRLHWSSMRFSRDWAGEYGTTPARFDMMLAIARAGGITQAKLRRTLDVCGPVVSRMVKALLKSGLLTRERYERDRRTYWIVLTERGEARLSFPQNELLESEFAERALRVVVADDPRDPLATALALTATNAFLGKLRQRLRDRSTLRYPGYLSSGDFEARR